MRLRIYQFLLPDRPILARYRKSSLVSDGGGVYTAILYVNRQIYDKAAGLLYKTRAFSIELHGDWLSMCNLSKSFAQNRSSGRDHYVLDYQLQRMLLGQQGLFTARQGQYILLGASSSANTPTISGNQPRAKSPVFDTNAPIKPVCPLARDILI